MSHMAQDLAVGTEIAHYRIESLLGVGGMSQVYLAEHARLKRKVALKLLAPELSLDPNFRERFIRESQLAASLDHPNVIPIYEADETNGRLFIAMRYVRGIDLKSLIRSEGQLSLERTFRILAQVASALDAAHARDLVHRDVKPENILIDPGSDPEADPHVFLADFGLTKRVSSRSGFTAAGEFVGTINYMAPEQVRAESVDGRADVYALGCVLYECLTGEVPFPRELEMAVLWAHIQEEPPKLTARRPDLPSALDGVIARAMAKSPGDRYSRCGELVAAVRTQLEAVPGPRTRFVTPAGTRAFDVFLSQQRADDRTVERLASRLKAHGMEPWLEASNGFPQRDRGDELRAALRDSSACAVLIGPDGMDDWEREELRLVRGQTASRPGFRLIPVLLPGLPDPFDLESLPPFLASLAWVDLRGGIDDELAFASLVHAIKGTSARAVTAEALDESVCPYRGLLSFDEEHARFFFGRGGDVQRLVEKLKRTRFLSVLGPSGSGKSSLVRAGLIPALRAGVLPGSEAWEIRVMKPGAEPLAVLGSHLAHLTEDSRATIAERMRAEPHTLHLASSVALAGRPEGERLVWVIDQFEEVFTLCRDEGERAAFVSNLLDAATAPGGRAMVVITMRADFYPKCAAYPELAHYVAGGQFLVSPMQEEGLRQAISEPAAMVGLRFDEGLIDSILDEVRAEPGGLPLLEHALLELWERRRDGTLTLEAYRDAGGVEGALAKRADAVFEAFDGHQQGMARRVLLRLTQPGEGTEDTRRRARVAELVTDKEETDALEAVLDELIRVRLLTASGEEGGGGRWVEVSHEALIRAWPRLRGWIEEDRAGLRLHRRLTDTAQEWADTERDEGLLFRGARLAEALEWRTHHERELNELERDFLEHSRATAEREAGRLRRTNRRLRGLLAGVAIFLVVALVAGSLALIQRGKAVSQRARAQHVALVAESQRLGAQALVEQRLDRSLLLAREAINLDDSVETRSDLLGDLLRSPGAIGVLQGNGNRLLRLALSPDGRTLAASDTIGYVMFFDTEKRHMIGEPLPFGNIGNVAFGVLAYGPDGKSLVVGYGQASGGVLDILDAGTHRIEAEAVLEAPVNDASFSPDGTRLAATLDDGSLVVVSAATGSTLRRAPRLRRAFFASPRFAPDGKRIVASIGDPVEGIAVLNARTLDVEQTLQTQAKEPAIDLSPDGRTLAEGSHVDGAVWLLDLESGRHQVMDGRHEAGVNFVRFSPDGRTMATTSDDRTVILWDVGSRSVRETLAGHSDSVLGAAFSSDGRTLYTDGLDKSVIMWDVGGRQRLAQPFVIGGNETALEGAFTPDGSILATPVNEHDVQLWDTRTLSAIGPPLLGSRQPISGLAFSPDGRLVVATSRDGVFFWDVRNRSPAGPPIADRDGDLGVVQFSPDGRTLAIGSDRNRVLLFDAQTRALIASLPTVVALRGEQAGVHGLAFKPDGTSLAAALEGGAVDVWNMSDRRQVFSLSADSQGAFGIAFSPDGRTIATGGADGRIVLWDAGTGRTIGGPLTGLAGAVLSVGFDKAGSTLVGSSTGGTVQLWDVATHKPVGSPLPGPANAWVVARFDPDGKHLLTEYQSGQAYLWDVDPAAWEARACQVAGRNLSQDEWREFLPDRPYQPVCPG
jgi:serine/threonine protein kinase/WD40 repeat protein